MIALSPALLIASANAFVGFDEEGGDNRGQVVEHILEGVGVEPGLPWCAAFVYHVGFASHYDHRSRQSTWPLPRTASCWELGQFAAKHGLLEREPEEGDVFLRYSRAARRFNHTGIVISVDRELRMGDITQYTCTCIEGNTNVNGSVNGTSVLRRPRGFGPDDRFIRWVRFSNRMAA